MVVEREKVNRPDWIHAVNLAFGAKLRQARRAKDVSQDELGSRVGLSRVTIATIERGKQNTQLQHVFLLAKALDMPVSELMPTIQELEAMQIKAAKVGGRPVATSDILFLESARALLLQMRAKSNDAELSEENADRRPSKRLTAKA